MHNLVTWASDLRKYNESGEIEKLWTELEYWVQYTQLITATVTNLTHDIM